jgi:hypothetical protein
VGSCFSLFRTSDGSLTAQRVATNLPFVTLTQPAAAAAPATAAVGRLALAGVYQVAANTELRVRNGPSLTAAQVAVMRPTTRFPVLQLVDDWMTVAVNRVGVPLVMGTGNTANQWYCARRLGEAAIPGSDGQCGPNNGPQVSRLLAGS